MDEEQYKELDSWIQFKIDKLNELTRGLMAVVKKHRPETKYARTLYAPVLISDDNEEWLSQSYEDSLKIYDYVVIMAYPYMEEVQKHRQWLKMLVEKVKKHERGIEKTVFKVQSYDWNKNQWVNSSELDGWLRALVAQGAHHIGYYPDDFLMNIPDADKLRMMMSKEDFPYKRDWK